MSVGTFEAFLGHATHSRPVGRIPVARSVNRRRSSASSVAKITTTSRSRAPRTRTAAPSGNGSSASSKPSGAFTSRTRASSRIPSFFHIGVAE